MLFLDLGGFLPPFGLAYLGEVGFTLILSADNLTSIDQLTHQCGNSLVSEVGTLSHRLDDVGDGVSLSGLHTVQNSGLNAVILNLLGSRLLLGGVLLRQQNQLVLIFSTSSADWG